MNCTFALLEALAINLKFLLQITYRTSYLLNNSEHRIKFFSSYSPIWHIFRCIFAIHYENH